MLLRLMKYDIILEYKLGKEMQIPDTLSRASHARQQPSSEDWDAQVHLIVNSLPISDKKMKELQVATAEDVVLCRLKEYILAG